MHFGATLRLLRMEAGLTLREVARSLGVSSAYLSRVENGHDPSPTVDRLVALAQILNVSPALLIDLAQQAGAAVSSYVARVPAAGALFLDVARRELSAADVARLRAHIAAEFPLERARADSPVPKLSRLLTPEQVVVGLRCADLADLIDVAALRLADATGVAARELTARLLQREGQASSALGSGVILPHDAIADARPAAALLVMPRGLALETPDGRPVRVAVVVIGPARSRDNLELFARIARLASLGLADELSALRDPERMLNRLAALETL